jgi:hypothetical protein
MIRVDIQWQLIKPTEIQLSGRSCHLYAIEKDEEIKYIGYAYELSLSKEITEYIRLFKLKSDEIIIWCGTIVAKKDQPIGRDMVESIICLLVNQLKPQYNTLCKSAYYGYGNISITNNDFPLIPHSFSIYSTQDYRAPLDPLQR